MITFKSKQINCWSQWLSQLDWDLSRVVFILMFQTFLGANYCELVIRAWKKVYATSALNSSMKYDLLLHIEVEVLCQEKDSKGMGDMILQELLLLSNLNPIMESPHSWLEISSIIVLGQWSTQQMTGKIQPLWWPKSQKYQTLQVFKALLYEYFST